MKPKDLFSIVTWTGVPHAVHRNWDQYAALTYVHNDPTNPMKTAIETRPSYSRYSTISDLLRMVESLLGEGPARMVKPVEHPRRYKMFDGAIDGKLLEQSYLHAEIHQ